MPLHSVWRPTTTSGTAWIAHKRQESQHRIRKHLEGNLAGDFGADMATEALEVKDQYRGRLQDLNLLGGSHFPAPMGLTSSDQTWPSAFGWLPHCCTMTDFDMHSSKKTMTKVNEPVSHQGMVTLQNPTDSGCNGPHQ